MEEVFRKEYKYQILKSDFYRIKKHLEVLMKRDIHSGIDGYMVRSLYFDSIYDTDLYDNLDGLMEKRKIRLRIYSLDEDTVKLEYKCKSGSDGKKYLLRITRNQSEKMIKSDYHFLTELNHPLADTLYHRLQVGAYIPKTVVEYQRLAYIYPASDVRITFDTGMRATGTPFGFFSKELAYYPLYSTDRGVLEIKYNDFLPYPIKNIIESVNQLPVANSKYVQARFLN